MSTIKKYREKMNWTQAELAEKCGVAVSAVSMWESLDRVPQPKTLVKLAEILGCTTDEILADVHEKEESA